MTLNCNCPEWKAGMGIIIGQPTFCQLHSAAPVWPDDDSPIFKFCSWCGRKLAEPKGGEMSVGACLLNIATGEMVKFVMNAYPLIDSSISANEIGVISPDGNVEK